MIGNLAYRLWQNPIQRQWLVDDAAFGSRRGIARETIKERRSHGVRIRHSRLHGHGAGPLETRVVFEDLLKLISHYAIDEGGLRRAHNPNVRGFTHVRQVSSPCVNRRVFSYLIWLVRFPCNRQNVGGSRSARRNGWKHRMSKRHFTGDQQVFRRFCTRKPCRICSGGANKGLLIAICFAKPVNKFS